MEFHTVSQISGTDRVVAASLAAFSMFVVGYSATRVILNPPIHNSVTEASRVTPHQAALWDSLGQ